MYDDDGKEMLNYRTSLYHRDIIRNFVKEAEGLLGPLLFDRKHFRGDDFPEKSEGVTFEGLSQEEVDTLDHLERCIHSHSIKEPKGLRW